MSNYIYLVCPSHDEPVKAEHESGQHLYDLPTVRFNWLRRDHCLQYIDRFPGTLGRDFDHLSYFERNTFHFLRDHRDCGTPYLIDENGERYSIESPTIEDLLSLDPDLEDQMNHTSTNWINSRISDELANAFDKITTYVREGYCTPEDVFETLSLGWGEGVADGWREWCEEGAES